MRRPLVTTGALLAVAAGFTLTACGGSSSSGGAGSTPTAVAINGGGGSFCDQSKNVVAQLAQLGKSLTPSSPGATPNVSGFKQLIAAADSAIDSLDGSAPGEIATAFHTLRTAYDQASAKVQTATTFQEMSSDLAGLDTPAVKTASDQVTAYFKNTCGINPSATP